ncbi:FAD/FMN-containing dehydrogenase [Rhypophila decipiens]
MSTTTTSPNLQSLLLDAGLPASQIHTPSSDAYVARQSSYWSICARSPQPSLILQPTSAQQISRILPVLVSTSTPFAVRSGGHMVHANSNNISSGVTLDLGLLNSTTYDPDTKLATIQSGARWKEVYTALEPHGVVVPGGREGNVGVGGLLLGGGNTFFTARKGWACDNVVSYEVILADGTILPSVTHSSHPDLFRVLKGAGCSANFGIVTSFVMTTIPCTKVWGGMIISPKTIIPKGLEALVRFTDRLGNDEMDSRDDNLIVIIGHNPMVRDNVVATLVVNVEGKEGGGEALQEWLSLDQMMNMSKMTSIREMAHEYIITQDRYDTWFTLTFKNDIRILEYCSAQHDKLVEHLIRFIPEQDFETQCLFQPVPRYFGGLSGSATGGPENILGLEKTLTDNSILLLAVTMVKTAEQEKFAYPLVKKWVEDVKAFAESVGGAQDWLYLNYADGSQRVLESYGQDNVKLMREVSKKYDPEGVFARLCPGGFKIPLE